MGYAISKSIDEEKKTITWTISPETIRIYAYLNFWLLVLVGWWLTTHHSHVNLQDNLLKDLIGFNSICVYFDHPPSNYVLPAIWAINYLFLMSYAYTSWLRVHQKFLLGEAKSQNYWLFTICTGIEVVSFSIFTTIFAVGPDESLLVHMLPFTGLVLGLSILSIKNFFYYNMTIEFTRFEFRFAIVLTIVHLIASIVKLVFHFNILFGELLFLTHDHVFIHRFVGGSIWMLTAAIIPIFTALKVRGRAPKLVFRTTY